MQPTFLGIVKVPSSGTPVPLATDTTLRACAILVATVPDFTGNIFLGGAGLNQTTLAGVMIKFNAPSAAGVPDHFLLQSEDGNNSLHISDYWLDVSVSGEGALVTYFQT
ncbi:MAG TPA: hypothetical protein VJN43_02685 [Bryobacteraceae bacterium]|nr:hypothetical protein [Bryobacteraceae bacterium]